MSTRKRQSDRPAGRLSTMVRGSVLVVAVLTLHFVAPVSTQDSDLVARSLVSLAALGVMLWTIVTQARQDREKIAALVMLLILVVVVFSLSFFAVETTWPDQFVGLSTRIDSLYFTVVMMATVGFGDVHAEGQAAKLLVTLAIVFDVVVVAAIANAISRQARERFAARRHDKPHPDA